MSAGLVCLNCRRYIGREDWHCRCETCLPSWDAETPAPLYADSELCICPDCGTAFLGRRSEFQSHCPGPPSTGKPCGAYVVWLSGHRGGLMKWISALR